MRFISKKIFIALILISASSSVPAQGFLKNVGKALTENVTETAKDSSTDTINSGSKIKESDIPTYTCQLVYELDENNNRIKNEDGTDKYRVFLVNSKTGQKVSSAEIEKQSKDINNAILKIVAKVGTGAALGALSGEKNGALIGIATGLGLSVDDIMLIIKLKKNSNKQKKALALYKKSFSEEGVPVDAKVDPTKIKGLDISSSNAVAESTSKIKEELESESFNKISSNASIDALLEAATKA